MFTPHLQYNSHFYFWHESILKGHVQLNTVTQVYFVSSLFKFTMQLIPNMISNTICKEHIIILFSQLQTLVVVLRTRLMAAK